MQTINCAGPGMPAERWPETLFRTVTAPLWLAAMGEPTGQDSATQGRLFRKSLNSGAAKPIRGGWTIGM